MNNFKSRILAGETVFGCWLNLGSSITAEIVGAAGFDWVLIDLEHGSGTDKDLLHQLQALQHTTAVPIVRVESYERQRFHRVLDLGAQGIMCPRIHTPNEARRAARAMRYQPEGDRGAAMMVRAAQYGTSFKEYFESANETLVGVVQIETTDILHYLDEVAATDGVDVLFIGPLDLSIALGVMGETDHPKFIEAAKTTADAAAKAGKAAGVLMKSPRELQKYHDLGFRFIACGSDAGFVNQGAKQTLSELRG